MVCTKFLTLKFGLHFYLSPEFVNDTMCFHGMCFFLSNQWRSHSPWPYERTEHSVRNGHFQYMFLTTTKLGQFDPQKSELDNNLHIILPTLTLVFFFIGLLPLFALIIFTWHFFLGNIFKSESQSIELNWLNCCCFFLFRRNVIAVKIDVIRLGLLITQWHIEFVSIKLGLHLHQHLRLRCSRVLYIHWLYQARAFFVYIHIRIGSVRASVLTCAVLFLFLFQFSSFIFILRLQYHLWCASFFARLIGLANAFKVAIHFTEWNLFAIYFGALECSSMAEMIYGRFAS